MHTAASATADPEWRKSSRSGKNGNCVELAWLEGGRVAVRNSRNPQGAALMYDGHRLASLVARIKEGDMR
nr:DUF397 domain-containing protein [Kibdelosporangium sp. MJ126-NF4]CEL20690.1 FIG01363442: possible membrane protein [Kibdelosporangium sp. MJ126-NF4]CTQ89603.1 hypothetical protein [Kibdelosporangium sp. MJ126-NF4]